MTNHITGTQHLVVKLALSNSTSRADGSDTPESLLEGCIDNQAVTQAFVVKYSAKGQVLEGSKMVITERSSSTMNTTSVFFSTIIAVVINNYAKLIKRQRKHRLPMTK